MRCFFLSGGGHVKRQIKKKTLRYLVYLTQSARYEKEVVEAFEGKTTASSLS